VGGGGGEVFKGSHYSETGSATIFWWEVGSACFCIT